MTGRLSILAAALVVARRDFTAILFGRSFLFFLLGPLFPVLVGAMAGGIGQKVQQSAQASVLGVAMSEADAGAMLHARRELAPRLGAAIPELVEIVAAAEDRNYDVNRALTAERSNFGAIVSGTPERPVLTGPLERVRQWQGPVSMIAAQATGRGVTSYPEVAISATATSKASVRRGEMMTAQASQTLLFLLTMLLAGMVLSNLVEEKANKIIEVLAAAIPMDAVFLGKLFAMLAISFVGIAVWGAAIGLFAAVAHDALPDLPRPAVGWPVFIALGIAYFSMAYLLLGSVFLSIGSMAATVREVQTLSMPVTMMQLMVFFLASFAMTQPGSPIEAFALIFPFSSPFAMLARGAQSDAILPHVVAIVWQAFCVALFVRIGARLFRDRVMKSGPARARPPRTRWLRA